ncbi:MAG: lipopolysaccharide biosynthesis protein [Methylobacter sp.]|nr:lipopolysaccharide biosynthesis protein [Methylobacter sp.]
MQLGTSIRRGTLWLFTGSISQRGLDFFFGIILARLLLPSDFGLLVTTQVFTGVASFIAGGGMGQALIQSKEVTPRHFHVVFTLQLLICSLIYATFFFIAPWIAIWFDAPIYTDLLRISAVNFLIRPFGNISSSKLNREMRFKSISIIGLTGLIISSSSSVFFAWHHFGVWSLIYGGLIGSSISAISLILHSRYYPRIAFNKDIAKQVGVYGFKITLNDVIDYLKQESPNFIISKYLGSYLVGLFNKGASLSNIPGQIIIGSAYQTVFRALSAVQDNLDQSKYIYLRTITLMSVYSFPFYIGLFWLSEPFVVTVYGEKWRLAAVSLQIFSIAQLWNCQTAIAGAVMAARNLLGIEIKLQIVGLVMTIIGCWYGIQKNDLGAISLGLIPSSVFMFITQSFFALRAVKASFKDLLIALKPAILMNGSLAAWLGLADYLLKSQGVIYSLKMYLITLSIGGALFYIILFLYWPIESLEKEAARWKKLFKIPLTNPG